MHDPETTVIYTLSLHDALPISRSSVAGIQNELADPGSSALVVWRSRDWVLPPALSARGDPACPAADRLFAPPSSSAARSEEHTSELQSQSNLVCRLLPESKKMM